MVSRSLLIKNSNSIENVWQMIRLHYGFQSAGAHFIDFANVRLDSGISHLGKPVTEDEELSPTLENFLVLTWLQLIHRDLHKMVKQRYGIELCSSTLATIKPEISQALPSLLDEVEASEHVRVMRAAASRLHPTSNRPHFSQASKSSLSQPRNARKSCPLCKEARRPNQHFLSECLTMIQEVHG